VPLSTHEGFENKLLSMTTTDVTPDRRSHRMSLRRRVRRLLVRARVSPVTVPLLLLLLYAGLMVGLTQVADQWIVALATTPLLFALLLTVGCLVAYRRDFYA
jgi:hypothetical protein